MSGLGDARRVKSKPRDPWRGHVPDCVEGSYGHDPGWDMDPERHVAHGFDADPVPYKGGPFAFRSLCDCGQPIYGRTPDACERHVLEHLAGKR